MIDETLPTKQIAEELLGAKAKTPKGENSMKERLLCASATVSGDKCLYYFHTPLKDGGYEPRPFVCLCMEKEKFYVGNEYTIVVEVHE